MKTTNKEHLKYLCYVTCLILGIAVFMILANDSAREIIFNLLNN